MTITSLGGIGGFIFYSYNKFSRGGNIRRWKLIKKQVFMGENFEIRTMLPLSLSYDHRIIDGAEAARFNNELKKNLGKNFAYRLAI